MTAKLLQAAGSATDVWTLLPELIGTAASDRLYRAALPLPTKVRKKR